MELETDELKNKKDVMNTAETAFSAVAQFEVLIISFRCKIHISVM